MQGLPVVGLLHSFAFFGDDCSRKDGCNGRWRKDGTTSWASQKWRRISEGTVGVRWQLLGCGLFPMLANCIQEITLVQLEKRELTLRATNPPQGKRISLRGVRFTHVILMLFFFIH